MPKTLLCSWRRLLNLQTRPRSTATAAAATAAPNDPSDHRELCLSLLPNLLRRGLIPAAHAIVFRVVRMSSFDESVSAVHYATSLGLDVNYATLLESLVASAQFVKAEAIFTRSIKTMNLNSSVLESMIFCYTKLGKLSEARKQLGRLIKIEPFLSESISSTLLSSFCAKEEFLEAHSLLVWLNGSGQKQYIWSYNVLIPRLCSSGQLDKAHNLFDIMLSSGIQPTVHLYKSLVYGFVKVNRVLVAEKMLESMQAYGLFPDLPMYTAVMQGYCREGSMGMALDVFNKMGKHVGCCSPDISVFTILVYGFMKQRDFDGVGLIFKQAIDEGLRPDRKLCSDLINWYCRNEKVDSACLYADMMLKYGLDIEPGSYLDLIRAMCKKSKVEEAYRWLGKMLDSGIIPDSSAFVSLIKSYPKPIGPDIVRKIFLAMARKNDKLTLDWNSHLKAEMMFETIVCDENLPTDAALAVSIHALCISGKTHMAIQLMETMVSHGYKILTFTYNYVLNCFKEGQLEKIDVLISLAQNGHVVFNSSSYLILIDACCKQGAITSAIELLDEMIDKGHKPTVAAYDSIIGSLCRDGRLHFAEYIFERMLDEGVWPDEIVYTKLINGYFKMGQIKDACSIFGMMRNENFEPGVRAYSAVINGLVRKNMFHKACKFLKEMLNQRCMPDTVLYTMLINQFGRKGQVDFAFNLYYLMIRECVEPNLVTFGSLIAGACRSIPRWGRVHPLTDKKLKEVERVLSSLLPQLTLVREMSPRISFRLLVEKIKEAYGFVNIVNSDKLVPDLYIYNGVVRLSYTLHGIEHALAVVDSMRQDGIRPNHVTYTILIDCLIRSREVDAAIECFNLMNKHGCIPDEVTYNTLIKGLCLSCRGFDALGLVYTMQKRGYVPSRISYDKLVECFCLVSDCDLAVKIFKEMLDLNYIPRAKNYNNLIWVLCREEKLLEAYNTFYRILEIGKVPDQHVKKLLLYACYRQKAFDLSFPLERMC